LLVQDGWRGLRGLRGLRLPEGDTTYRCRGLNSQNGFHAMIVMNLPERTASYRSVPDKKE